MPSTTTYNCLNIGAGLIKANIFALDNLNPSVTAPQQAKITVTINAASPFTADIYKQPSADVDAATEATYKLFQQSFTVGTNVFDVDITDMFSKTSEAETYIRVAPVNAATFDISGKVIITADTTRPSNIVKRTLPTEAQLSFDVGDIGTASVNLRDGSLSFSHADWVLGGGKTAFSLIHTYNSARCDSDEIFSDIHSFAGKGWKTNFHQYLAGKDKFASYIDTSGSEHFFAESGGKIYDKSGLGLYLDASGNCKELYDESGNILRFSPGGMLCCVESAIGNDFYIGYEESGMPVGDTVNNTGFTLDGDRVTRLQDNDRVVLFGYADELQNPTAYSDTRNDVTFSYADNTLTLTDGEPSANEVTVSHEASQVPINGDILTNVRIAFIRQGDKTISFAYTNNLLSSVVHPDVSEQLRFSYSDGRLTKISKVIGQDESVQAQFAYNADGKLCRVYGDDYAQLYISYNQNGMVSSVSRSADNSPGTTIDYSSGATVVTNELGAKTRYTLSDNGDIMTIHNITDGCEEQLYPETNTSARVISSATFIGGNNINSIVGVTVNSESIPFGQGEFTIKDLRTTLGNIAKNNSSFDFVYDKGRKKICGVNSTSCRLNTSSSSFSIVSGGMPLSIDYETTVKDVTQSNTIKITVTETFAADYIQSVTTACDAKTNTVYPSYTKTVKSRYDGKTLSVLENNLLTEYTYDSYGNITQTKARKNGTTSPNIITSAVYDETNGNKTRETDANGFATTYTYLMPHNLVSSISKPTGSVTYTYDAFKENLVSANGASVTMDKKKIKAISKSNLNYNFEYSEQGDLTAVTEGSSTITSRSVSYTAGGKTVADTVGGTSVSTVYNKYGKPSSVSVGTKSASIQYTDATSKAKVAKIIDNISGVTTTYSTSDYDESAFTCSGALAWSKKAYIKNGKVFSAYNINGDSEEIAYFKEQFDRNGKTVSVVNVTPNYNTEANTVVCESQADDLGRVNKISCSSPNGTFSYRSRLDNTFEYKLLTNGNNSRLVQKETVAYKPETSTAASTAATRTYTYDSAGNVTKITTNNGSVTYTYAGGRLTHESNGLTGQNVSYEYDSFGNITKKTVTGTGAATHTYSYDSNWPDLLKKHYVDGIMQENVAYTACCPSSVNGNPVTWERGLVKTYSVDKSTTSTVKNIHKYTFTYDVFGKPTKREHILEMSMGSSSPTVFQQETVYYYYDGEKLVAERGYASDDTYIIHYIYDDLGICGVKLWRANTDDKYAFFHFDRDIFGSVVGIYGNDGKVLDIRYDAFGKPYYNEKLIGTDTVSSVIFRIGYKGYYYDSDSGLYFTGKEYYNPETGRYLVPQSVDNLGFETDGLNLFAYKHNRPLNVNEIKTATTSSTYNYTNSTDLDISQALLIGAGAIGNVLDIADSSLAFVSILKNIKFGKFTSILGSISAGISFVSSFDENRNVFLSSTIAGADILSAWMGSKAGVFIGGLIGGLAGAILGTLISILLTEFIDYILDWLISELLF